jgi:hypothetical protein
VLQPWDSVKQVAVQLTVQVQSVRSNTQGMYNGREGMPSLSSLYHLKKAQDITYTIYYLLLSSLIINAKIFIFNMKLIG